MKKFIDHTFDFEVYERELSEFKILLDSKAELSERNDILPFFKARPNLSSQIATLIRHMVNIEKIAFEFDVYGDFASDIAVGDLSSNTFCFIEFEDAKLESIFVQNGSKYKLEFSSRLEHGFSQIIDWFYKLDGLQNTDDLEERFGKNKIEYEGILIIGRDQFLDISLKKRLDWRARKTVVNSKHFYCYTFDELYNVLDSKIKMLRLLTE
jgi:hypothetical protein